VNGRAIVSFLFGLVALVLLIGLGAGVYDAGVRQGLAQAAALPAGTVVPYAYGYGFHGFGFGFLGLLFPILFLFIIFGLLRAAVGGGRRGWGYGHRGWGPGGPWMSDADRGTWEQERDKRMADLHRRFHEGGDPNAPASTPPTSGSPGSTGVA
jgi:hypothetical protein